MKGKTPPDEYTEDTSLIRGDKPAEGEVMDTFDGVPDDVIEEAMEELADEDYSEDEIRLMRIKFMSVTAN